ncbi:MAG: PilZ domain-containing protein [Myxococcota bacterium]|nr:PilZ domain-containing protein [Myxococcota bacterium]
MSTRRPVLILGEREKGAPLAGRVLLLDYRALQAESPAAAAESLAEAPGEIRAVLLAEAAWAARYADLIGAMRAGAPSELTIVALGGRPDAGAISALREAGVRLALFGDFSDEELRFVVNRAHRGIDDPELRTDERVPTDLVARVVTKTGERSALVYGLSCEGAFLVTQRPAMRGGRVQVGLKLPGQEVSLDAEVVWNNVPGNLRKGQAPVGMGVRFAPPAPETAAALRAYVKQRTAAYLL